VEPFDGSMKSIKSKINSVVFARLHEGEDLLETIKLTAEKNNIDSGFFFLIGTLKQAKLGYYKDGKYMSIEKQGPLEIISCMGNISIKEKTEIIVHGHIAVSDINGSAYGGHILKQCIVDATVELVLVEAENNILQREYDVQKNLNLWSIKNQTA
jgi:predicted DNA-binding protein with PD1-like motif